MGSHSSKSSIKNNNRSKQVNFVADNQQSKYSGMKSVDRTDQVLTKFTWNYGGNSVYLTGSFNGWKKNIPMEKQGDQFCVTLLLPRHIHQYKFIVDGEWRFSPEDATMSDHNGYINNYIDTTKFQPQPGLQGDRRQNDIDDESGPLYKKTSNQKTKQKKEQYAKYAPKIPPHYEHCLYLGGDKKQVNNGLEIHPNLSKNSLSVASTNTSNNNYKTFSPYSPYMNNSPYEIDIEQSLQRSPSKMGAKNQQNQNRMYNIQEQGDSTYEASLTKQEVQYLFNTSHSLPMPTHSVLDHIMLQKGEWIGAMAITQRFREKYTTFIHYTMNEEEGSKQNIVMKNGINQNLMNDKNRGRNINNPNIHNHLQHPHTYKSIQSNHNTNNHMSQQGHGQYQHVHQQPHYQHSKDYVEQNINIHHFDSSTF